MFYLGLLLPICYVAGYTGASIPTQWPFLSFVLVPVLWRSITMTLLHWLGLIFIAYVALSILWSPNRYDSMWGLYITAIAVLSFWLGSSLTTLVPLFRGLALGLTISTAVAIIQWFGYFPVAAQGGNLAGLLYNQTVQGAAIALVIVGLVWLRQWPYIPALLPGLYLAHSRGGWLILCAGLISRVHWSLPIALTAIALAFAFHNPNADDILRLQIWSIAWHNLSTIGWGPFISVYYRDSPTLIHPEFVHDDYLQLVFEYGFAAIIPITIFAAIVGRSPVLVAFACLATFYFPLHAPVIAFIGCVVAGHVGREFSLSQLHLHRSGPNIIPRPYGRQYEAN